MEKCFKFLLVAAFAVLFISCQAPTAHAKFTVSFDCRGGSAVASQTVEDGSKTDVPAAPVKAGSDFLGWYREPICMNSWDFAHDAATADMTLYAKWAKKP